MTQWLLVHTAFVEDTSWIPTVTCGSAQPPVTPAPQDRSPLASEGIWTNRHILTYRHTFV